MAWVAAWSVAGAGCATAPPEPSAPRGSPSSSEESSQVERGLRRSAVVEWVYDGDSIRVDLRRGGEQRVRLLGIDTPEGAEAAECGADEARAALVDLVPPGTRVVLVRDPGQDDRDRYDRMLRHVEVGGRDAGALLVEQGLARVYVFRGEPFLRADDYRVLERSAREQDRGSWGTCWR